VWLSDSNDALQRARIQHDALHFVPPDVCGSHVGPRVCHTSQRVLSMTTRAWVAAMRWLGFEFDPRELDDEEEEVLIEVVRWWKANRGWMFADGARTHRLDLHVPPHEALAEITVCARRRRFVVLYTQLATAHTSAQPLALAGLDARATYRVTLLTPDVQPYALNRSGDLALQGTDGVVLSGAALMGGALRPPTLYAGHVCVLQGALYAEAAAAL